MRASVRGLASVAFFYPCDTVNVVDSGRTKAWSLSKSCKRLVDVDCGQDLCNDVDSHRDLICFSFNQRHANVYLDPEKRK